MSSPAENLPASPGPSDAALVVMARAGEAWACEALYRRHARGIFGLAFRLLGRDEDVDDLVQDSFVTAFATLDALAEPAAFRSWVAGILVRKTRKLLRRRKLLARFGLREATAPPDIDSFLSPSAPTDVVAELRAIYAVIDSMSPDVRAVLLLRRIEGHTLEEVAELTGMSLATVKRKLAKGEAMLRTHEGESR